MNCELLQEDLCAYVDNELEPAGRAEIEAHVATCEECAEEALAMRAVKGVVGRLRLHDEDPPDTLTVFPEGTEEPEPRQTVAWWRRPIKGRTVALAAAAVLVALLFSYTRYERHFMQESLAREAVVAHLAGVASDLSRSNPGGGMTVSLPAARVGSSPALQTVHYMGRHAVSELRLPSGSFDAGHLKRYEALGKEFRAGRIGDFSVAACDCGTHQVVLVSDCSPEALVAFAQNLPLTGPAGPSTTRY